MPWLAAVLFPAEWLLLRLVCPGLYEKAGIAEQELLQILSGRLVHLVVDTLQPKGY